MTSTADPHRPRRAAARGLTPGVAGAAALAAIAVLLWVVLGAGRGDDDGTERRGLAGARRVPTVNAVEAVPLGPVDPSPLAALGGPGSVVRDDGALTSEAGTEVSGPAGQRRERTRARRAPRPRSSSQPRTSPGGYRVIGPGAGDAPAPPPPQPAPPAED
jgi:hypothetical protein